MRPAGQSGASGSVRADPPARRCRRPAGGWPAHGRTRGMVWQSAQRWRAADTARSLRETTNRSKVHTTPLKLSLLYRRNGSKTSPAGRQNTIFGGKIEQKRKIMKKFQKPQLVAQGSVKMADCRPNSRPCGRPCNPPGPGGHR